MPGGEDGGRSKWVGVVGRCADEHGVLLMSDAKRAGVAPHQIRRLVDEGLLLREFRGVYRWAGAPPTDMQRIKVAVCATRGVASHESAARLWDFERWDPALVHVTVARGVRHPQRRWMSVHESRSPLGRLAVVRHGIEVMKPLPTLAGVAGGPVADEDVGDLFAHFVSRGLLSVGYVARFAEEAGSGIAGVRRLRRLLAGLNGGPAGSVPERDLLRVLAEAGIEKPRTQFAIYREGRFVARADAAWPEARVALEVDGYRYHSDPVTFVADRERGNEIVAAGYRLLRTTPTAIRQHPDRLCDEVSEALKQASESSLA